MTKYFLGVERKKKLFHLSLTACKNTPQNKGEMKIFLDKEKPSIYCHIRASKQKAKNDSINMRERIKEETLQNQERGKTNEIMVNIIGGSFPLECS